MQACAELNGWQPSILRGITALVQQYVVPSLGGHLSRPPLAADTAPLLMNSTLRYTGGDPSRVYLTGQSMGGNGAWVYAAQQHKLFAAVAVVCGCELLLLLLWE